MVFYQSESIPHFCMEVLSWVHPKTTVFGTYMVLHFIQEKWYIFDPPFNKYTLGIAHEVQIAFHCIRIAYPFINHPFLATFKDL